MLGAHLLLHLLQKNKKVKALCRKGSDREQVVTIFSYYTSEAQQLFNSIEWIETELEDVPELGEAMAGVDQVYHCAAKVSFDPKDAEELIQKNPEITANVMNTAKAAGVNKMVHVSSVAALGRQKQGETIDEKTEWVESKHNSAYAKSKYLSELEAWRASEEGLNVVIVNPSIILGPAKWDEGSAALFGRVAKGFKYYTHGVNAYVDARDVARAMVQLMESDITAERFVLVSENKSYKEVFDTIAGNLEAKKPSVHAKPWMGEIVWRTEAMRTSLMGGTPMVTRETARTAHQMNYYSSEKAEKKLGFQFRPVEETIKDIAGFYQKDHST